MYHIKAEFDHFTTFRDARQIEKGRMYDWREVLLNFTEGIFFDNQRLQRSQKYIRSIRYNRKNSDYGKELLIKFIEWEK